MKWHKWPEAVYTINYSRHGLPKKGEEAVISLLVDAHTFMEVEDFAQDSVPDGWEITSIEKAYNDYAKMFGGDDGKWIDIQLTPKKPANIIYGDIDQKISYNRQVVEARNRLKVEISSIINTKAA